MKARSKLSSSSVARVSAAGASRSSALSATPASAQACAGDIGPFLADVQTRDASVGRQGQRHRRRAVAGEGPDLEDALGADELHEQRHEGALVRPDLHGRHLHRRSALAQLRQHGMLAHAVAVDIVDDVVGEVDRAIRHAAMVRGRAPMPGTYPLRHISATDWPIRTPGRTKQPTRPMPPWPMRTPASKFGH